MENSINSFRRNLLQEDLYKVNAEKYIEKVRRVGTLVIWGSAIKGQMVYNFLKKFDADKNVKYYADNSKEKWGTKKNGLLILSPNEVINKIKEDSNIRIIIATENLAIRNQLLSLGIKDDFIDIKGLGVAKDYLNFDRETPYMVINSHINKYEKVYSYLSDDLSKKVYLGILNCKISLDNRYLEGIADPENSQYFDEKIIKLNENEVFCDCGSYNGDTLETFVSLSGGKYKKYIAIEADGDIFSALNKKVTSKGYKNIKTYNLACWHEKTILKFQSAQTAGHITETGDISVHADTLDNILKYEKVTFLKMDIEGAEEMALKGASTIIKKDNPILAICLYHNLEDYYKLPLMMKNLNPEYKLFIRHYRDMFDLETVCYAIPKERLEFKTS